MHWFSPRKKSVLLGIDIGARYLKLLEITFLDGQPAISQFGVSELPMNVLTERHEIKNPATISACILKLLSDITVHTRQVAIAVSGSAVVTKEVTLSAGLNEVEMEEQAWLEAGRHFPDLIEDLTLDFYVKDNAQLADKTTCNVMLIACRKTTIEKITAVIKGSDLRVEIIDVDYYALERILTRCIMQHRLDPMGTYAVFNVSSYSSIFLIFQNHKLLYSYNHVFDAQEILQKFQEEQKWDDLVLHPKTADNISLETVKNSPAVEEFIFHVNHALALFYSSKENSHVGNLFLAGDCALIPHIDRCVEERINLTTKIATTTRCIPVASDIDADKLHAIGPALALCCGLALHEGNQ